tara:strand:- start:2709 stop:3680 length:972 start_codon:yes stop_codon:yes gene_type:complete
MKLFSGSTNTDFSIKVSRHLGIELSDLQVSKFSDGETKIVINESIRKHDCYVIQPTGPSDSGSVNDSIMELFIICDALKRGSASSVNVVMPYYGYQRQDRKDYSRAPISAKIIASCLESLHIDRIIVFDLHAGQIQGFFSNKTPVDNLYVEYDFIQYIKNNIGTDNIMIISPDEGGMKRAVRVAGKLGVSSGAIYKERGKDNRINQMKLMCSVENKICIIVDDIIDTAGTCSRASHILKENGAQEIYMIACHGVFSGSAFQNIKDSCFRMVVVTNTLDQKRHNKKIEDLGIADQLDVIDVSWMCSEAIRSSFYGESLHLLYDR